MSYQVLARKWRPRKFSELVGQEQVVKALSNGLAEGRVHHAFLFTGTRGVGKTTLARILAKSLNCMEGAGPNPCGVCEHCTAIDEGRFVDLLEVDAASRTKVDDTREILDNVQYAPSRGRYKVYLIDEVHMLSGHSFNALLKTLEEPPDHVKFVLATTDPQKIPVTILSRCLQFNLRRLTREEIRGQLERVLDDDGIKHEEAAVTLIARAADGSMRDALSLLDQALAGGSGQLDTEDVKAMLGTVEQRHVLEMLEALADRDAERLLGVVEQLFSLARDLERVLGDLGEALHRLSLIRQVPDFRDAERTDWEAFSAMAERFSDQDLQLFYQIAITGRRDMQWAPDARTGLEMTLLRMMAFQPAEAGGADQDSTAAGKLAQTKQATSQAATDTGSPVTATPRDWPELLNALDLSGAVRTIASHLALIESGNGLFHFEIHPDHAVFVTDRFKTDLRDALAMHQGGEVNIRINTSEDMTDTPARRELASAADRQAEAEASIDADPTVAALRDRFDAAVVPGSVRPRGDG